MRIRHIGFFEAHTSEHLIELGDIDPVKMDEPANIVIQYLLDETMVGKCFAPNRYILTAGNEKQAEINYAFACPYGLGVSRDKYGNLICKVTHMNLKPLGAGRSGSLYPAFGKVIFRYDDNPGLRFESDYKQSVFKQSKSPKAINADDQPIVNQAHIDELKRVLTLTQDIPTIRTRPSMVCEHADGRISTWTEQRRHRGVELFNLINDNYSPKVLARHTIKLEFEDRFEIMIAMWKALKKQMFDQGFIHRDIKLENMLAYKDETGWHVMIVDVEFIVKKEVGLDGSYLKTAVKDDRGPGTAAFISKEGIQCEFSESSDIFAMGLSCNVLWHCSEQITLLGLVEGRKILEKRIADGWLVKLKLFNRIDGPDKEGQEDILKLLTRCTAVKASDRPDIDTCIAESEHAYLSYKKRKLLIEQAHHYSASVGMTYAAEIREALSNVRNDTLDNVLELRDQFIEQINKLPDDSDAIAAFVSTLNIECLKDRKTKARLIEKLMVVARQFFTAYQALAELLTKMAALKKILYSVSDKKILASQLNTRLLQLDQFCRAIQKTPIDFDTLCYEAEHMRKKFVKEEKAYRYFERQLPRQEEVLSKTLCL